MLEPETAVAITVRVEVPCSVALQRCGLMFRRSMPADAGMLFVFDEPEIQRFWMRNTFLRLDMIFIDSQRRVVGVIENATPLSTEERAIDVESQYVLEVHGGFAAEHAVAVGTSVRFVGLSEE